MHSSRRALLAVAGIASVAAAAIGLSPGVPGASAPGYSIATLDKYGGEPSIVSDTAGRLYDTTPSIGTLTYRSTNHRTSWTQVTTAHPRSGDDCLATDQSRAAYLCHLNRTKEVVPLQADVWESIDPGS